MTESASRNVTPWQAMVPEEADRFGPEIFDLEERRRWCGAILVGGLPYMWRYAAGVPRRLALDQLELREGDSVLVLGEAIDECGFDDEIRELVGTRGEVVVVDFKDEVRDKFLLGEVPKWEWAYTREYPDERFDSLFVVQGHSHSSDWRRDGAELLRVLRPGRRIVLAEIAFSDLFYSRLRTDLHLEYWVTKLMEGIGHPLEQFVFWSLPDLTRAFEGLVEEPETFEWRGVEMLWGRKS